MVCPSVGQADGARSAASLGLPPDPAPHGPEPEYPDRVVGWLRQQIDALGASIEKRRALLGHPSGLGSGASLTIVVLHALLQENAVE